jgi:hypothetical protein
MPKNLSRELTRQIKLLLAAEAILPQLKILLKKEKEVLSKIIR